MALQGDLGSIPLADVIQLVSGTLRSGTLYVASPDDARVLQFRMGAIVSAASLEQRFRLGHALLRHGLIDPVELERAEAARAAAPERALSDILLKQGAVTADALHATLREQVQEALDEVLCWRDGGFLFADAPPDDLSASVRSGLSFVVQPLLLEALRRLDERSRLSGELENPRALVRFADNSPGGPDLAALPPNDDALELLELVDGKRTIAMLRARSSWSENRVVRTLAQLVESGLVKVEAPPATSRFTPFLWTGAGEPLQVAPRAAARAIALAEIEGAGLGEMHAAALADPGLAVAVLRAAKKIGRQEGAQFSTLHDAVLALGEEILPRVLVAAGLRGCYCEARSAFDAGLWRHSLVTAIAAARLANALGMTERCAAEAYLCGLLHDAGAMLLRCADREHAGQVRQLVESGTPLLDAERRVIGIGHDKVGSHALEQWGAGPALAESALMHHVGPRTEPWQVAIVIVADAIARSAGFDPEAVHASDPPLDTLADQILGVKASVVRRVAAETIEEATVRDPLW